MLLGVQSNLELIFSKAVVVGVWVKESWGCLMNDELMNILYRTVDELDELMNMLYRTVDELDELMNNLMNWWTFRNGQLMNLMNWWTFRRGGFDELMNIQFQRLKIGQMKVFWRIFKGSSLYKLYENCSKWRFLKTFQRQ